MFIDAVASLVRDHGNVTDFTAAWFCGWVSQFQRLIALKADAAGATTRAFAATLSAAIVGETTAALMQVGDGAVIAASGNDPALACLLQPFNGEYANTTSFLTDVDALETSQHRLWSGRIEDLAVITDGLGRVALNMQTREAYTPFFRPMFRTLGQRRDGHQRSTSLDLHDFLHSTRVNQRVDDDKTLIVASRRPASVCPVGVKQDEHEPDRVG